MSLFSIDAGKCKRDGICIEECPIRLIEMEAGINTDAGGGC